MRGSLTCASVKRMTEALAFLMALDPTIPTIDIIETLIHGGDEDNSIDGPSR